MHRNGVIENRNIHYIKYDRLDFSPFYDKYIWLK